MKTSLFAFLIFSFSALFSQDKIVTHEGKVINGKVEEIGISEIKYRKQENPGGPLYVISKSEVHAIHFENGTKEEFGKSETVSGNGDKKNADPDYVPQEKSGDDVYTGSKDGNSNKKGKKKYPRNDRVVVVAPIWHALGWFFLGNLLFGCW